MVNSTALIGKDGTIYVGSGDNYFYAIKHDGTLKWKYKADGSVDSAPVINSDGIIYFSSRTSYAGESCYLYAIDSGTSSGLADSAWPMFQHDLRHTGRYMLKDLNGNGSIELEDAIIAIQILSGMNSSITTTNRMDVNNDNKVGVEEAIYILQKVSGLR